MPKESELASELFFRSLENFEQSCLVRKPISRFISIFDEVIEIKYSGDLIFEYLWPALSHLEVEESSPALTINVWDGRGGSQIHMPWNVDDLGPLGVPRSYNSEVFDTTHILNPPGFSVVNHKDNIALFWLTDSSEIPTYLRARPLTFILNFWFKKRGIYWVHAACVGTDGGAVLLPAKGGSGKSTTAMACLSSDLLYVGDDCCLVSNSEHEIVAHSLSNVGQLTFESYARWQEIWDSSLEMNPLEGLKKYYFLYPEKKKIIRNHLPLKAIVIPSVSNSEKTSFYRITQSEALRFLAPSSLFEVPGSSLLDFNFFASLAKRLPAYKILLGSEIKKIPEAIIDIISQASSSDNS